MISKPSKIFLILICLSGSIWAQTDRFPTTPYIDPTEIAELPAIFRQNKGQWNDVVKYRMFQINSSGAEVVFMQDQLSYNFVRPKTNSPEGSEAYETLVWNLHFENTNANTQINPSGKVASHTNYLKGNDWNRHALNVPDYSKLTYCQIYTGIDLQYYSYENQLKYDFIVKPEGKISDIRMRADGIKGLSVNRSGELEIETDWGTLVEQAPYSYQYINGIQKEVDIRYSILGENTYGFHIYGNYDPTQELIIDPIILNWSTRIRSNGKNPYIFSMVRDDDGFIYVTGKGDENFYITPGAYDNTFDDGGFDAFIMKFSPDGSNVLTSTYLGGTKDEWGTGIALGPDGSVFVAGWTSSDDFPISSGAYQGTKGGVSQDGFVAKLNPAISAIDYCTFVGGSKIEYIGDGKVGDENPRHEIGNPLAVNNKGEAYLTGWTTSSDFPATIGSFNGTFGNDCFLLKLNASGTGAIFNKLFGGTGTDKAKGVVVNDADEAFVTGYTQSTDFPTTPGAYHSTGDSKGNMFVIRHKPDGSYIYSTLIKGSNVDEAFAIAINDNNEAFVAGASGSPDFGTTGSMSTNLGTVGTDVAVLRLKADGSGLIWSTWIGGNSTPNVESRATGIAVSSKNIVYVTGQTRVRDFPLNCEIQSHKGSEDVFVTRLNNTGGIEFSTYMGGNYNEYGSPKVVLIEKCGCVNEVLVSGTSHSTNFPTTAGAFEENKINGDGDQPFIFSLKPEIDVDFTHTTVECAKPVQFDGEAIGNCIWKPGPWNPDSWWWDFGDGNTSTEEDPTHTYLAAGTYEVKLVVECPCDTIKKTVTIPEDPNFKVDLGPDQEICSGQSITLDASGTAGTYKWSTGASSPTIDVTKPGEYWVQIDNGGACKALDTVVVNVPGEFNIGDTSICAGKTLTLDAGAGADSYNWSTGSNEQTIDITLEGEYWVEVVKGGCTNQDTINVTFDELQVNMGNDKSDCQGTTITLDAGITGSSYTWSTGANTQSINVTTPGKYWVEVDDNGCKGYDTINVEFLTGDQTIKTYDTTICSGGAITLEASNNGGNTYEWSDNSNGVSIQTSDAGIYWVKTTLGTGGCASTIIDTFHVNVDDPLEAYNSKDINICDGATVELIASIPGNQYTWSDNSSGNAVQVNNTGTYWVATKADSGSCGITVVDTFHVQIGNITADFAAPNVCMPGMANFTDESSPGVDNWLWDFGDGNTSTESNPTHSYTQPGTYTIKMIASTNSGCIDSASYEITVNPSPVAGFEPDEVCEGGTNTFVDTSKGNITTWEWDFGDGTTSTEQNPPHQYSTPGTYDAQLIVTTDQGCKDTIMAPALVTSTPEASFNSSVGCAGAPTAFTDESTINPGNIVAWEWDFGDSQGTSTEQHPNYTYSGPGTYEVKLVVTTAGGCKDSIVKSVEVHPIPEADFVPPKQECVPVEVDFEDKSTLSSGEIVSWWWDFGDGTTSTEQNPSHEYTDTGSFDVTLIVTSAARCRDTVTIPDWIKAFPYPTADFEANPWEGSILDPDFDFTDLSSSDVIYWEWDFGDGSSGSNEQHPHHTYNEAGEYDINLTVNNEHGCTSEVTKTVKLNPIFKFYVPNAFTPNGKGPDGSEGFIGQGVGVEEHEMWVYDRWGLMIYNTDNTKQGRAIPWNGKVNGTGPDAQEDVYVYVVKIKDIFGKRHKFVGHVTLLK